MSKSIKDVTANTANWVIDCNQVTRTYSQGP